MPENLRAILIDPFACTVTEIDLPRGDDLAAYYSALSHETMKVSIFEAVRASMLRGHDVIFVDEEGTFKPCDRFFSHAGFHSPLIGKGLIVGANAAGDAKSADTPLASVKRCVVFLERIGNQLNLTDTPWMPPQ